MPEKDPNRTYIFGQGLLHAIDNAQIDPERLPGEYVEGDIAENITQELVRGLSETVDIYYQPSPKGEGKFTFVSDDWWYRLSGIRSLNAITLLLDLNRLKQHQVESS